jgi:hypothetical protein
MEYEVGDVIVDSRTRGTLHYRAGKVYFLCAGKLLSITNKASFEIRELNDL